MKSITVAALALLAASAGVAASSASAATGMDFMTCLLPFNLLLRAF